MQTIRTQNDFESDADKVLFLWLSNDEVLGVEVDDDGRDECTKGNDDVGNIPSISFEATET